MKKVICSILVGLLMVSLVGCGGPVAEEDDAGEKIWRMAIVFNGPVNDGGWNQNAWNGLLLLKDEYGDSIEVTYAEKIDHADYEDTFYGYASDGYDLILANGFEFLDAALRVADQFPEAKFAVINGLEYRENLIGLEFDNVEYGFVLGVAAASAARERNGKVAFMGAEEIPSYRNCFAGIQAGVAYIDPDIEVSAFYTGSWTDVTKATEMTLAAYSAGYDVFIPWIGAATFAMYGAMAENEALFVQTAPEADAVFDPFVILNTDQQNQVLVQTAGKSVIEGGYPSNSFIIGNLSNGVNKINDWGPATSSDTRTEVDAIFADLLRGDIELPQKVTT